MNENVKPFNGEADYHRAKRLNNKLEGAFDCLKDAAQEAYHFEREFPNFTKKLLELRADVIQLRSAVMVRLIEHEKQTG